MGPSCKRKGHHTGHDQGHCTPIAKQKYWLKIENLAKNVKFCQNVKFGKKQKKWPKMENFAKTASLISPVWEIHE